MSATVPEAKEEQTENQPETTPKPESPDPDSENVATANQNEEEGDEEVGEESINPMQGSFTVELKKEKWRDITKVIGSIAEEAVFEFLEDGLHISTIDEAKVAFVELDVDADEFSEYESDGVRIGMKIDKIEDVISVAGRRTKIEFDYIDEEGKVYIGNDEFEFGVGVIDPVSIRTPDEIPEFNLPGYVKFSKKSDIKSGVKSTDIISDHVRILVEDSGVTFKASDDTDEVEHDLEHSTVQVEETETGEIGDTLISLDYLTSMVNAIPQHKSVELEVGEDHPIKLRTKAVSSRYSKDPNVTMMIAPRIEAEDE